MRLCYYYHRFLKKYASIEYKNSLLQIKCSYSDLGPVNYWFLYPSHLLDNTWHIVIRGEKSLSNLTMCREWAGKASDHTAFSHHCREGSTVPWLAPIAMIIVSLLIVIVTIYWYSCVAGTGQGSLQTFPIKVYKNLMIDAMWCPFYRWESQGTQRQSCLLKVTKVRIVFNSLISTTTPSQWTQVRHFVHIYSRRERLRLLNVPRLVMRSFVIAASPSQGRSGKQWPFRPCSLWGSNHSLWVLSSSRQCGCRPAEGSCGKPSKDSIHPH